MTALAAKVLEVAAREIGVREVGRNRGERVETYLACVGLEPGNPWCAAFVSWVYLMASRELALPCPLHITGGALKLLRFADPSERSEEPDVGAIFVIDHGGGLGHVGIVEQVERDHLVTIEGNSDGGGSREGDGVYRRVRRRVDINRGYIVPRERQGPGAVPSSEIG